ncbi:hypothetical protein CO709_01770 [Burkholderia thailandensis]|nr:hypothetical protein CO709_01770 [Burkholderia thailandensis]KST72337.1 hypothetical protein WS76_28095 [Burkholderia humptydooensis]
MRSRAAPCDSPVDASSSIRRTAAAEIRQIESAVAGAFFILVRCTAVSGGEIVDRTSSFAEEQMQMQRQRQRQRQRRKVTTCERIS